MEEGRRRLGSWLKVEPRALGEGLTWALREPEESGWFQDLFGPFTFEVSLRHPSASNNLAGV